MLRGLVIGFVLLLLLGVGVLNLLRDGSIDSLSVKAAQDKMDSVPLSFGPWKGRDLPSNPHEMKVAQSPANSNRVYTHENGKESVHVLLLFGPTGDQGAHDPETCYGGRGFKRLAKPVHTTLEASEVEKPVELWSAPFLRPEPLPEVQLELCWGWGHEEGWQAPNHPRFALVGRKMIYKIYIQRAQAEGSTAEARPIKEFLIPYFRELNRALNGTPNS